MVAVKKKTNLETCYNHLQTLSKGKGIPRSPQLTSLKRSKILPLIMLASLSLYRYFFFVYLHVWVSIFSDQSFSRTPLHHHPHPQLTSSVYHFFLLICRSSSLSSLSPSLNTSLARLLAKMLLSQLVRWILFHPSSPCTSRESPVITQAKSLLSNELLTYNSSPTFPLPTSSIIFHPK